jgi:hypothetical protein
MLPQLRGCADGGSDSGLVLRLFFLFQTLAIVDLTIGPGNDKLCLWEAMLWVHFRARQALEGQMGRAIF